MGDPSAWDVTRVWRGMPPAPKKALIPGGLTTRAASKSAHTALYRFHNMPCVPCHHAFSRSAENQNTLYGPHSDSEKWMRRPPSVT